MNEYLVHQKVIDELKKCGWKKIELNNKYIIEDILKNKIFELNKEILEFLDKKERNLIIYEIISDLKNSSWYNVHKFLKFGIKKRIKKLNEEITFKIIDFDNIENNEFTFVYESYFGEGKKRPDFVLYVNGIPFVVIEVKKEKEDAIDEALGNILFYESNGSTKELFNYAFISCLIIGEDGKGFYKASWPESNNKYLLKWKKNKEDFIFGIFNKEILLDLFKNFNFLLKEEEGEYKRVVANFIQYEAVKNILKDVSKYKKALVWHWQGSGKTWTLFFTAYNYYKMRKKENKRAFIFVILDRIELKNQSSNKYKAIVDLDWEFLTIKKIENSKEITKTLKSISEGKENSSIFITLIQKFRNSIIQKSEDINLDEEILVLVDEAHRSVNGDLLLNIYQLIGNKNLRLVGFTGTPVIAKIKEKNGKFEINSKKSTFRIFSPNIEKGKFYTHLYFIKDSIRDGITVPLFFENVVIEDFKIPEKKDIIEKAKDFIKKYHEKSLMDEIEELNEEEIELNKKELKKIETIFRFNNFVLNDKRLIEKKAELILNRIKDDTENFAFKAFIVASSRYSCIKYKKAIDKIAKEKKLNINAEVVITWETEKEEFTRIEKGTSSKEDVKLLINYGRELLKRVANIDYYNPNKLNQLNEEIVETFKEDKKFAGKKIDILIVTSKLLTGFDYPRLKVMYLDKAIGGVSLLQAVARTNRVYKKIIETDNKKYKVEKKIGLILDLTGINIIERFNEVLDKYKKIIKQTTGEGDIKVFDDVKEKAKEFLQNLEEFKKILEKENYNLSNIVKKILNNDYKRASEEIKEIVDRLYLNKNIMKGFISKTEEVIRNYKSYKFTIAELLDKEKLKEIRTFIFVLSIILNKLKLANNEEYLIRIDFDELKESIREITDFGDLTKGVKIGIEELLKRDWDNMSKVDIIIAINNKINVFKNEKDYLSQKIRRMLEKIKKKIEDAKEKTEYLKIKKELEKEIVEKENKVKNLSKEERFFENLKEYLKDKFKIKEENIEKYKNEILRIYNDTKNLSLIIFKIRKILKEEKKEELIKLFDNKKDEIKEELKEVLGF